MYQVYVCEDRWRQIKGKHFQLLDHKKQTEQLRGSFAYILEVSVGALQYHF